MVQGWVAMSFDAKGELVRQDLNEGLEVGPVLLCELIVRILGHSISIVDAHHGQISKNTTPPFPGPAEQNITELRTNEKYEC